MLVQPIVDRDRLVRTIECWRCCSCGGKWAEPITVEGVKPNCPHVLPNGNTCNSLYYVWCSYEWPEPLTVRPEGWPGRSGVIL